MTRYLKFTSLLYLLTQQVCLTLGFRGSVVEYNYQYNRRISSYDNLMRNAAVHANIINLMKGESDLIVFPEGSLSPISGSQASYIALPLPSYTNTSFYHTVLQKISDAAKSSKSYVVINVPEKDGKFKYSTSIVFRANGTLAARYRKYHVGGEDVDRPALEPVQFDTDFGVKFGLISSPDLLYASPVRDLLKAGVKYFVCPSAWISELPFLTSSQVQQSFAWSEDVTLLAAGLNSVDSGQSGSGIFVGKKSHLTRSPLTYYLANIPTTMIITSNLRVGHSHSGRGWNIFHSTENIRLRELSIIKRKSLQAFAHPYSQENKMAGSWGVNELQMDRPTFKSYTTKLIEPNRNCNWKSSQQGDSSDAWRCYYDQQLCHGNVCCRFNITVDFLLCNSPCEADSLVPSVDLDDGFFLFRYRMAVFDGVERIGKRGDTWGAQICSIVSCLDSTLGSCGMKPDVSRYKSNVFTISGSSTRVWAESIRSILITGTFNSTNSTVMPNVLLGRGYPMSPSFNRFGLLTNDFMLQKIDNKTSFWLPDQARNLGTAGILNRVYSRDGLSPTGSQAALSHSNILIALTMSLIIYSFVTRT